MALKASEIIQIMEKAKELGLSKIKVSGMEAVFSDDTKSKEVIQEVSQGFVSSENQENSAVIALYDDMTDEEIQYLATPYFDELMAKKEAKKKKIQDEAIN